MWSGGVKWWCGGRNSMLILMAREGAKEEACGKATISSRSNNLCTNKHN